MIQSSLCSDLIRLVIVAAMQSVALENKVLLQMIWRWISTAYAIIIHLLYDDCTTFFTV